MRLNDRARNKGRMAIYAMAGVYLDYMAYSLFKSLSTSSGGEKLLMIVFMIFFAVVGTGLVVFGLYTGYKLNKETNQPKQGAQAEEDIPAAEDVPVTEDIPAAVDVSATEDIPAAVDVPVTEDIPAAVDVPATEDIPAAVDVAAAESIPQGAEKTERIEDVKNTEDAENIPDKKTPEQ